MTLNKQSMLTAMYGFLAAISGGLAGAYYTMGRPWFGVVWTFTTVMWVLSLGILSQTNYHKGKTDAYREMR